MRGEESPSNRDNKDSTVSDCNAKDLLIATLKFHFENAIKVDLVLVIVDCR
jgi:hypothetical protein